MKYIVFKKHSVKKNKDYFELAFIDGTKWTNLGFVDIVDKTQGNKNNA